MSQNLKSDENEPLFESSEVLAELDIGGQQARVLRIAPDYITDKDLQEHARNLADVNAAPRKDIRHAAQKQKLRGTLFKVRERIKGIPLLRKLAMSDDKLDLIYPDLSAEEHFDAYSRRGSTKNKDQGSFTRRMSKGRVFGIELDGRIVSVLAYDKFGETHDGRPVLSLGKASTLHKYRGRKLHPTLQQYVFQYAEDTEGETPIWHGASVNPEVLSSYAKKGWHVVDMDADIEAVQIAYQRDKKYIDENMIPQGYKAFYMDPRVDKPTPEI